MGEVFLVTKEQMEQLKNDPNWLPAPTVPAALKGDSPMDAVRQSLLKTVKLKKDVVILAGTVFATVGNLVVYEVARDDPQFADWFEEVP